MTDIVYIAGSGHSGSTLLDRMLGQHPEIAALGEIHRFSLALHRQEGPFRCDCGETIRECGFWQEVNSILARQLGVSIECFYNDFQTTSHRALKEDSGAKYFNAQQRYQFLPKQFDKYAVAILPPVLKNIADNMGILGRHLEHARNSHALFEVVSQVSGKKIIIDSTKNPVRMRSLYLARPAKIKIINLKRDGRAVANSRMKRQNVDMPHAARVWLTEKRKVEFALNRMKGVPILNIRYEDLCRDNDVQLQRIYDFLGIGHAVQPETMQRHAIGGNPSRFNRLDIKLDDAWRTQLTEVQLNQFAAIAGSANRG